jgi:hypothetical protein
MIQDHNEDEDPIVAEVRKARADLLARYNNDLRAFAAAMQQKTEEARLAGRKVVSRPPRRPQGWDESAKMAG